VAIALENALVAAETAATSHRPRFLERH
jgi:hypothetical protein